MYISKNHMFAFAKGFTVTFVITENGTFKIIAFGQRLQEFPCDDVLTVATKVIKQINRPVKYIEHSDISHMTTAITSCISRLKRAVSIIENAYLNPHTMMGRKRLLKEFEIIITDI